MSNGYLSFVRFVVSGVMSAVLMIASATAASPARTDHKSFAAASARLSEQGGYFDSDNLISNETSYLHVMPKLKELGITGGVYIGVGPDQSFSYIAKIRPRMAIMIDIRRDNLLQHLLYKALFGRARNRIEYLCLFFGKPFPKTKGWDGRGIKDLVEYIDGATSDSKLFEKTVSTVRQEVQKYGIPLSASDIETIGKIQRAFYSAGLEIRYSSYHRPPRSIYPTYRDLLLETDLAGQQQNYFAREDDFQFLKRLEEQDMIIPAVGDLSGPQALKAIGQFIAEQKERVSAFYLSNVEFYLARQGTFDKFVDNLRSLPIDSRSMIIRSYFNYYAPSHPQAEPNHFSTQLLERIEDLLKQCATGECDNYNDIVTKNSILLR
ncbi:MAG TPA: hypothetical protein VNS63_02775 [Blastocatellia bacterium]|nr:hypothetical protein [Blastocatellia bacterium]